MGREPLIRSLFFDIVILVISHFGSGGGTLVLIAKVPGHFLSFTSRKWIVSDLCNVFQSRTKIRIFNILRNKFSTNENIV